MVVAFVQNQNKTSFLEFVWFWVWFFVLLIFWGFQFMQQDLIFIFGFCLFNVVVRLVVLVCLGVCLVFLGFGVLYKSVEDLILQYRLCQKNGYCFIVYVNLLISQLEFFFCFRGEMEVYGGVICLSLNVCYFGIFCQFKCRE